MKSLLKLFLLTLVLLLAACSDGAEEEQEPNVIGTPPALADPIQADESIILGQVVSISGKSPMPLSNTEVRLASVFWNEDKSDGAFSIDETSSPVTFTDPRGGFILRRLESRDYVIVIGDLYGQNVVLSNADGSAVIYTPEIGQAMDVGVLEVDLEAAPIFSTTPETIYPSKIITSTPDPEKYP